MTATSSPRESDFLIAMGEEFGLAICPPVDISEAAPNECDEAISLALGDSVTPELLATLGPADHEKLASAFGSWFECEPPSLEQITKAVTATLVRWPAGSLGD